MSVLPGEIINLYKSDERILHLAGVLRKEDPCRIGLDGICASLAAVTGLSLFRIMGGVHLFILPDQESAAYFSTDLENLEGEQNCDFHKKNVLFFPSSFRRAGDFSQTDATHILMRTEVLSRIQQGQRPVIVVSYPEAIAEKVVDRNFFLKNTLRIHKDENLSISFLSEVFTEYHFDRVDFVVLPGQYAVRGGIVDVYSFSNDKPYRIEFNGDIVESIRSFDLASQLSLDTLDHVRIVPDIQNPEYLTNAEPLWRFLPESSVLWFDNIEIQADCMTRYIELASKYQPEEDTEDGMLHFLESNLCDGRTLISDSDNIRVVEMGLSSEKYKEQVVFHSSPQPVFNKNFDLLLANMHEYAEKGYRHVICSDSENQLKRIRQIIDDITSNRNRERPIGYDTMTSAVHEGYIDHDLKLCLYTDHQIFDRYFRFRLLERFSSKEAITLKGIQALQTGDYVTHIDHGVGRFSGLEKIEVGGKMQEAIRLVYDNNDLLYVSIHSLHKIGKYIGKDGSPPVLNRLGSNAWNRLKSRTKEKVKDIAKDLIKLYAVRKSSVGFAFSPDTYLQFELEASFIYQDTPDQEKATADVKKDMEAESPMDRLICGDVGFGKTEVAIRAAFKAVTDGKQVAVLVPTTILALQHFRTFGDRLSDFPCTVEYINRFKTTKQQADTLKRLEEGRIDILIGTHRLVGKDVKFKDLGLLILDEEQKFGVAVKEKLRKLKVDVDTLTLTATPIPRTLQFSLMGARDLSIINTPPPNRYPIQTEVRVFSDELIKDVIQYEVNRGGQAFFVHNRVQNIQTIADMVNRLCPGIRIAIGHGQMDGSKLEQTMLDFIDGQYDVLVSTTIIESGLDIPNVNTIVINEAQNYGLSDLHQLRGRVGRTNRKAFCYLLSPPISVLTDDARKRLRAIEEFSDLGSGFNIAMRDLDIRGAGNILGAQQSGFISEIGFEMYQKILDEALHELREDEYSKQTVAEKMEIPSNRDCQIETDLELLIPDSYVSNTAERMILYKELAGIKSSEQMIEFTNKLNDRFGPIPSETEELLLTIELRRFAVTAGLERMVLKNNACTGYFISRQDSPFYQSDEFGNVLKYVQQNQAVCKMKEVNNKLIMTIKPCRSVAEAIKRFKPLIDLISDNN